MTCGGDELAGKVAIVTGAAGEIGRVIASELLAAGACVAWVGRRMRELRRAAGNNRGDRSLLIRADVRDEGDVRGMAGAVVKRFGRIDFLINNAGRRGPTAPVTRVSRQAWQLVVETNMTGPFLCARECLKHMSRRRSGRIINISSMIFRAASEQRNKTSRLTSAA